VRRMVVDAPSETVWIHGHAGQLQSSTGFSHERLGYFLRLKADIAGETWVHYAVPIAVGPQLRVADLGAWRDRIGSPLERLN
jgi:hypothetical protein